MGLNETLTLVLVVVSAAVLPGLSRLVRLPGTVTEILMGIVLGKSLLGLTPEGEWLSFLAHLGFLVLMFHAGLEIDFAVLRRQSKGRLVFHFLLFGATVGMSVLLCRALHYPIFLALVLSTTSLGLVMPTLKELGYSKVDFGQIILIAATLADFLTLLGITFFILWTKSGLSWDFIKPLPLFVGFGLILVVVRWWAWWNPERVAYLMGSEDSQEGGVRWALALLFILVALSELVHLEPVLGAFMGGAVVSFVFREKGFLETKLSALGFGFLIPIFFINVGMQFDLTNVLQVDQIWFTLELLALALAVKILPSLLLFATGASFRSVLQAGLLLSTRLSLIVAAASIGLEENLITPEIKDSIVLLAVITCLLGPTLFRVLHRKETVQGEA